MDFISHTLNWCKGEIFEGRIVLLFGLGLLIISILFWRYGETPSAKGIIIPLVLIAVLCIGAGTTMNFSNQNRIEQFQKEYTEDAQRFKEKEKMRVETFMKVYLPIKIAMSLFILSGLFVLFFSGSFYWKSIALGLILCGFGGICLDHFSEERAIIYYEKILEQPFTSDNKGNEG